MIGTPLRAQTAGQNVNMVSGTGWTNGDPFLERQNEPSITVSTRNSAHLFGAANDYRSVDLPGLLGIDERGDAWLGVYKSFDGGLTWQSTLLPGFPLDGSPEGLASPIHGRQAAADPLVRAGSNGLFFLTGLAFDRGSSPLSKVFITRFIDLNNKENGDATSENGSLTNLAPRDPVKYIDTHIIDTGSANRFLDKPWVAVDIPRGRATCTISANQDGNIVTQKVPAGAIYVTYTAFTTVGTVQNSQILFRRSTDCGVTWSRPIVLSQNDDGPNQLDAEGQGTVIAIDPSVPADDPATIYVAWRVFAEPGDPDDANQIRIAKSTNGGLSFDEQEAAVTFPLSCNKKPAGVGCPFDQGETGTSFRSNGYPALTVDNAGRVYLAWSQRDSNGDGRIMMAVTNRVESWPKSNFREIDSGPVYDDYGNPLSGLSDRGGQLMPTLNFNAGKLILTYYDLRQDHTSGTLTPAPEPTCNPAVTPLCPIGNPFSELRQLEGELLTNPMAVFNGYIDDATLTVRRHTLDIVGSEGAPQSNPFSLTVPAFTHFRVSRYEYGIIPPGTDVQQAQFNAPNLPMFVQGTAPFMGDYIDVAGAPSMVPDNSRNSDGWKFNTSPTTNPVFHATWTDNRDVLAPPDGVSWNKYTPPISASIGPTSKFDPTQTPPACVSGYSGMRNQNIYTSAISSGLILTSPQTAKPVLQANGQPIPREFALVMRNDTNDSRTFQLTIPAQPASAQASFLQFGLQTTLTVNIPALSSASRPVFLTPHTGSTVSFPSFEVDALETDGAQPALTASILFNSDPTNPFLANPDNAAFGSGSISSQEFYNPAILNPAILNPAILNPAILNPAILNPAILNPAILNPNFVVALNPAILNPAILNPAILNNAVANPAILNPAILNTPVSDANYTITNEGNTSATYQLQLFQSGALPASAVFQIILTKTYLTPGVSPTDGCTYGGQVNNEVIASIDNPVFVTDPTKLGNPAILNSAINNPTFSMAPGDTVQITLRANLTVPELANVVLPNLTPVVASQAVNTVDVAKGITTPPISLLISTTSLQTAVTGQAYSVTLTALGGNPPLTADVWSLVGGSLPPGLNLSAAGVVSGSPTSTGTFPFVAQVVDAGVPQHVASRQLSIAVVAPVAITTPTLPNVAPGAQYTQVVAVTGGMPPYTWSSTGTLPPGLTLSSTTGVISGVPTTAGTYTFTVMVNDSLGLVATASYTIVVSSSVTQPAQVAFVVQPTNAVGAQAISPAVQVQVLDATGATIPNVQVTMAMPNPACPSAALSGTLTASTNEGGVASFANLSIDHGQRNYTLAATAGNAVGVSNPFNVEGYCETGSMNTARHNQIVLALPNGKILVTGGAVNPNSSGALASAEIYDPAAHSFTTISPMNAARVDHTMTLLPIGTVLITGGFNDNGVLSSAELFDPATNTFTLLTASMTSLRAEHTATLLPNGKVLIAGGNNNTTSLATAEIFDPAANTFTPSAHVMGSVRQIHHADLLPNGQVLISGGLDANNNALASAEIYNPNADTFTATGSMSTARGNHATALLYTGQILVAGGLTGPGIALVLTPTAELYNPATGLFTPTGSMSVARGHYTGTVLDDGTVFISGGATLPAGTNADIFDPATGTFRTTANFTAVQAGMRESILPDGTVVLTSGVNSNSAAVPNSEIFYPLAAPAGITITTSVLPNAVQNHSYTQLFLEHGGVGNLTWSAPVESLPPGLALSTSGILSGAPTASGTFAFTVSVVDSASPPKSATSGTLTLTVSAAVTPIVFAPQTLPTDFTSVTSYAPSLSASGGTPPYKFAVTSGALPTGISLGTNGVFSGASTSVGTFTFGVTVTDSSAPAQTATQTFTIQVAAPLAITTSTLPGGIAGTPYSANISSTGGVLPIGFAVTAGALPPGFQLALASAPPQTATLSGTPSTPGTFNFTITASDSSSPTQTVPQAYTVTIAPAVIPPANVVFVTPLPNSIEGQVLTGSPVQVRVTDTTNTPLPNASVSIGFNGTAPCATATLGGTLTQITDATGTATFADLTINRGQFGFALAAAAGNVIGVSNAFNVEGFCDTGSLATARALHSSVALPNGTVLIAGGSPSFSNRAVAFSSAELYSPLSHSFTTVGSMHSGRSAFTMTLLQNGLVLVAGGLNGTVAVSSAELFDPSTNTFTLLSNSMVTARVNHIATLLANGKVLITGGNSNGTELASAEIFDPAINTFTATSQPMTTARDLHQAALLPNGKVLITGGFATSGANNALASAELYDPVADTFTATGSMATPRYEHASALLFTGKVLVGGGFTGNGFTTPLAVVEIYDPSTGTFSPTTSAPQVLVGFLSSVPVLADGTVFLQDSVDAQIYDPTAGTFRLTGNTTTLQAQPLTALMADGTVLVTGGVRSDGNTGVANAEIFYPINIVPISITTVLPTALLNVPYSEQLQEKGGVGALSWTVASGTLPAGLTLSSSGLLSGTPTVVGASIFTVQVTDSSAPPRTTTASFTVVVVPPLSIVPFLPTANPGVAYSQPLLIAGGATPYTFSIVSGSLPSGLTLSNGVVGGTTAALGTFTFTVKVTDSSTPPVTATQAVSMTVATPLAIVTTTLPGGQVAAAYGATITASGGFGTVLFGLVSGTLPTGVTLTPQGVLSGTPNAASSFTFTIGAVDSSAEPQIAEQTYTVVIAPTVTPVSLGPASLPAATLGVAYSQNFAVSGGTPPYTVTQTGTLPPGLTFNGAANPPSITGTPTSLGTFGNIVVTAQDSLGAQAQVTYSITVNAFSAACGTGNESLFNGQYAVLMQGFDANGPRTLVGSIAPNGAGGFISGQMDIGTDLPAGGGAAQHLTIIPAQSSFSVGADRRGCMVLTTSAGSSSYRFVLATVNNGLSNGGRIIDFQQNGAYGAGFFRLQNTAFLASPSLNGSYAFIFSTPSSLANIGHWAMLGSFVASGGAVSSGSWDYNDTHSIDGGSAWATSGLSFPANETYAFDTTGRGTLQLPSVQQYSQSNTLVSTNIVVYPIGANEMYAAVLPDANNKPLVGDIQQQVTPFSSLTLNGSGFVEGASTAPIFSGAWVGLFSASQNAWSLSLDNDFADIYSTSVSSGTYSVDSTGRAPLAFAGSASAAPMVRAIGPNKAYFMLADNTSAVGYVQGFSGGVPPSSVAGSYAFGPTEGTMDRKVTNLVGVAVFDAAGNVTFTEDQATGSTDTLTPGAVVTSTYSYNASTGRGVIPATGTPHFVFDANQSGLMYLLDVTSVDPEVEQLEAFAPPAVTLVPDPLNLVVGTNGTMDVFLASPAIGNGQVVTLTSSNASVASVPASVTVLPGTTGIGFTVTAGAISGSANINAAVAGLPPTNATVNVTQMNLALSLPGPLLGVGRSFNATVTLASPAGANGVTVTLASSDATIATVSPASVTIAQGGTTATFAVNGIATGTVILTASASGFQNATTSLTITNSLISLQSGTVTVAPGQSGSVAVSLSGLAPTGGITITFSSGNTAVATITPNVFVPQGQQVPAANPQVTGVGIGSTVITASATGFAPDTAPVQVTVTASFSPTSLSIPATRTNNIALNISAPAPQPNGVTFNLSSDNTNFVTVPATAVIPAGQLSITVPVTGVAQGSATVSATSAGITTATVPVNVGAAPTMNINISTNLGQNLQVDGESISLSASAPANENLTLTSNSANVLLATTPAGPFSQAITLPLAINSFSVPSFSIQGLASSGTAQLTAQAVGYGNGNATVTLTPSGIQWVSGNFNTTTFSPNTNLTMASYQLSPTTLAAQSSQNIRTGLSASVTVTSSDTTIGTIIVSPVTINVDTNTTTVAFHPVAPGTTNLLIATPSGFATPTGVGSTSLTATVNSPNLTINATTNLGQNLQVDGQSISLEAAPPGNETLTLTSNSPNLLIANTPAGPFSQSINLALSQGSFSVPGFSTQSLANTGTAQLTAVAPGYNNGTLTINLTPSAIEWVSGNFTTTTFSANSTLTLAAYQLNPATLTAQTSQNIRTGASVSITVTSSDTTIGTIVTSPVTMNADTNTTTVLFHPVASGTANLLVATPTGFTTPTGAGSNSIAATVNAPNLSINVSTNLGQNLQVDGESVSLGAAPPSNETLTVTSNSPNLLIANTPAGPFSQSITLALSQGSFSVPGFSLQGLVSTGTAQLTASAAGYNSGTTTITFTPSAIEWLSGNFNTTTFTPNSTLTLASYQLNPTTLTAQASQNIRTGSTVSVTVTSSAPTVGTILNSPITISADTNTATVGFHPLTAGTANLVIATPTGFTTPAGPGSNTITATVSAPNLNINVSTNLGQNLQVDNESISLAAAPPNNETLTLSSSSAAVLLATTPAGPFSQSITLPLSQGSFSVPGFSMQGLAASGSAQLTAQAPGYTDATATIALTPSAIEWLSGDFNTTTFTPNTTLTLAAYQLNPATLTAQASQNLRTGFPVSVTVTSSNTAVGTIVSSPVTMSADTNTATVSFHPVAAGTANLVIATPAGFTTPNGAESNSISATVSAPNLTININTNLGQNLQVDGESISLGAAPQSSETLTLSSSSSNLLLATTAAGPFGQSITLPLTAGSFSVPGFSMQGLASTGSAQLTASAPGYSNGTVTINLTPSAIEWLSGNFTTTTFSPNTTLTLASYQLNPANLTAQTSQNIRTGLNVSVTVTTSDSTIGTIVSSPVTLNADNNTTTVLFHPVAAGTANLLIATPAGFTTPNGAGSSSITATVSAPNLNINASSNLGQNLQVDNESISLGAAPTSSETLTLTSSSAAVLLATAPAGPFSQSITLPLTAGSFSVPAFSMQGLASTGSAQLTASAPGYNNGTFTVALTPSAIEWNSGNFSTTTFSTDSTLSIASYQLSPATLTAQTSQNLRAGLSVSVTITSSDTTIGTILASPVTINPDSNVTSVVFHPVAAGTVNLIITTPAGFTTPNGPTSSSIAATVNAPNLNVNVVPNLGQDLQVDNESIGLGAAPPTSRTLTLSSGSAALLLATTSAGPFSQSITLPLTAGSFTVPSFSIQALAGSGTAQITASAPGYSNGASTVTLTPSGIIWESASFSTTVGSANTNLTVLAAQLSPTTLTAQSFQNIRTGSSVSVTVTSSVTTVGTIVTSPVTISAGSDTAAVVFRPVSSGVTNLVITTPTGFATPNGSGATSISATVN